MRLICNLKTVLFVGFVLFLLSDVSLHAGLKEFSDETNSASRGGRSSASNRGSNGGCSKACMETCMETGFSCWAGFNARVWFLRYPYSMSDNDHNFVYLMRPPVDTTEQVIAEDDSPDFMDKLFTDRKKMPDEVYPFYYALSLGFHYAGDSVNCGYAGLSGKFYSFIGPELEARGCNDSDGNLFLFTAGLNISICQFDYFSPDVYGGWAGMRDMMHKDGYTVGVKLRIYPVKPLVLTLKQGVIGFSNITYNETDVRLGVMFNRLEIFAGYRALYSDSIDSRLSGFQAGLTVWL